MKIEWTVEKDSPSTLKHFLKEKGVSRRMLAKVKFHGGELEVNDEPVRVRRVLREGDIVHMTMPLEEGNPRLSVSEEPLDILFEDDHYLIVNKPVGVVSVPSPAQREETMANRVKGYIEKQGYPHKSVHVVTRLDRDTSGVMIFAKHGLAHSMMDQYLKEKTLIKLYEALVAGNVSKDHGSIEEPIARSEDSIITRKVEEGGKPALSEYWVQERLQGFSRVKVQLHTGRTHQIRVHFSHIGHPLLGDDLYGGDASFFQRQALHCKECAFLHPFSGEELRIVAPLPEDLQEVTERLRRNGCGEEKKETN
jgi:23S rRNA pseudouridine1911/1915/1917 synthase